METKATLENTSFAFFELERVRTILDILTEKGIRDFDILKINRIYKFSKNKFLFPTFGKLNKEEANNIIKELETTGYLRKSISINADYFSQDEIDFILKGDDVIERSNIEGMTVRIEFKEEFKWKGNGEDLIIDDVTQVVYNFKNHGDLTDIRSNSIAFESDILNTGRVIDIAEIEEFEILTSN